MDTHKRWWLGGGLFMVVTIFSVGAVLSFAVRNTSSVVRESPPCRVALTISREEAAAAGVDWAVAQQQQGRWSRPYPCGDERAKAVALEELTSEKRAFLTGH